MYDINGKRLDVGQITRQAERLRARTIATWSAMLRRRIGDTFRTLLRGRREAGRAHA